MIELELTVQVEHLLSGEELRPWLDQFEREYGVRVKLTPVAWEHAWQEMVKTALYRHGPDVSQVGSTWVTSLAGMNAIKPFTSEDIHVLGGPETFLPLLWESGWVKGDPQMWAIPWLAYVRLFYYRRDWLEDAGIDEKTAFTTPASFAEALRKISEKRMPCPWIVPTTHSLDTIHSIGSWIWQSGGDFVSMDSKHVRFNQPEALTGMENYFSLYRYLPSQTRLLDSNEPSFRLGEVAVTMSGPGLWGYELPKSSDTLPEVITNTGVANPFGLPFIGGSHMVIWKHTLHEELALELVKFLTSRSVQSGYIPTTGLLPIRKDVLSAPPFTNDPIYQVMEQGLKIGRTFPSIRQWGLIEDKLTAALGDVWSDVLFNPKPDIGASLKKRVAELGFRLESTLSR